MRQLWFAFLCIACGCAGVDATYEVCREANGTACVECHFHEHDGESVIMVHEVQDGLGK